MRMLIVTMAGVLLAAGAASGQPAAPGDADPCAREPATHRVKIRVNNNNVPEGVETGGQDASTIRTCPGDTVEWHFTGLPFRIEFQGRAPFDAALPTSANGKVSGVISKNGTRGKSFKYDVAIDGGGRLDPIIIVD